MMSSQQPTLTMTWLPGDPNYGASLKILILDSGFVFSPESVGCPTQEQTASVRWTGILTKLDRELAEVGRKENM